MRSYTSDRCGTPFCCPINCYELLDLKFFIDAYERKHAQLDVSLLGSLMGTCDTMLPIDYPADVVSPSRIYVNCILVLSYLPLSRATSTLLGHR